MAAPRSKSDDDETEAPAEVHVPLTRAETRAVAKEVAILRADVYGEMDDTDDRPAPTIQAVMALIRLYLIDQYSDSLPDQNAVHDAGRMLTDGHVIPAWRHLARMVEQVLNVPPGG